MRVLVAEDEPLLADNIAAGLRRRSMAVDVCYDGDAALERVTTHRYDVVILDRDLPNVHGDEVCRRIVAEGGETRVLMLTAASGIRDRVDGLDLGADDYLTKPFAVEELHARLTRLVDRREALASAHRHGEALLSGSVEHLAISDLLQILSLNNKDGTVVLTQGDQEGRIEFVGGRIVHAAVAPVQGAKALFRMLGWASANFRVLPREGMPSATTIAAATANVLMDGLVSLDEWARWKDALPPQRARLMLSPEARARLAGQAVSPVEFDLLARAKTGTTIAEVIESSPHPDASVAEAICKFLSRGILMAVESPEGAGSIASSG
jgi:DNA-binding response OmpR family regulator